MSGHAAKPRGALQGDRGPPPRAGPPGPRPSLLQPGKSREGHVGTLSPRGDRDISSRGVSIANINVRRAQPARSTAQTPGSSAARGPQGSHAGVRGEAEPPPSPRPHHVLRTQKSPPDTALTLRAARTLMELLLLEMGPK